MADNKTDGVGYRVCENCRFSQHLLLEQFECRRRAPVVYRGSSPREYPVVGPQGWCGEWEALDGLGRPMK